MASQLRVVLTVAVTLIAVIGMTGAVSAGGIGVASVGDDGAETQASTTAVELQPQNASVTAGETITFDIVLTNADGGVGAFNPINVTVGDTDVATITDATVKASDFGEASVADDGSQASVRLNFGGDTNDTGEVTLATVTVTTESPGHVNLGLNVTRNISDEEGALYTISEERGTSLTVTPAGPETKLQLSPKSEAVREGDTVTYELILTNASGGVGAFDPITINVGNASTARITNISTAVSRNATTSVSSDGSEATVGVASGGDTNNTGAVTIATITVEGVASGATSLNVDVSGNIATEGGEIYDVTSISGASVDVASADAKIVHLRPAEQNLNTGGTTTFNIVITNVTNGVGAFDNITVTTSNASVVTLNDISLGEGLVGDAGVVNDGTKAYINVPFGGDTTNEGGVVLGSVTVQANNGGSAMLDLNVTGDISDEEGSLYEIGAVEDASVSVEEVPGPGDLNGNGDPATDPDGDGKFEDINGNGQFDIGDIQAFWNNRDSDAVQSAGEALDFNNNGEVDVGDIQALYNEYRNQN